MLCENKNSVLDMLIKAQKNGDSLEIHGHMSVGLIGNVGLDKIIKSLIKINDMKKTLPNDANAGTGDESRLSAYYEIKQILEEE